MMKKVFLLFLLCASVFMASAEHVGREKAMSVAKAFIANKSNQPLSKGSDNDTIPGPAPYDLAASVTGRNANLTWNAPSPETASLKYGDVNLNNYVSSYGYGGSAATYWGQRYPKEKLVNYAGMAINKFQVPLEAGTYTFYIYKGNSVGATDKMYEKSVTVSGGWSIRTINIDSPVPLDFTSDLWVIMCAPETVPYPADYCMYSGEGAADACYISKSVSSWSSVSSQGNFSWMMETFITDGTYTYNLYRDDTKIASDLSEKSYTDSDLPLGTYQYYVKTNYYGGESAASNITTVTITDGTQYNVTTTSNPTAGGTTSNTFDCTVIFELTDSYGDGWTDNKLHVVYDDGTPAEDFTIDDGYSATFEREIGNGVHVTVTFIEGYYQDECSYTIKYEDGTIIHHEGNQGCDFTVSGTLTYGQSCTVTATPAANYQFVNWTENGVQVSTSASYTFTVSGNRNLTANFELIQYEVTTTSNPTTGGTVSGGGTFDYGQNCTVTATPAAGYQFVNWTDENGNHVSTSASYTFTVSGNASLTANFELIQYEVTTTSNPTAGGTTSNTFDCTVIFELMDSYGDGWTDNKLHVVYDDGTPAEDFTIDDGYSATFEREIGNGVHVTVTFTEGYYQDECSYTIKYEDGTIIHHEENQGNCDFTVSGTLTYGHSCTVTATPNAGYHFVNWTEDANIVSTSESYTFTVTSDRSLVAHFELTTYDVSVTANPTEGGTVSGGGTYDEGATATVTATPNAGYHFVNWTEDANIVSTSESYTFTVTSDRSLVAHFELTTYDVSVTANPTEGGTVSGGGTFDYGQNCTVTATPNAGYQFVNWKEGSNVVSTSASYTFTVTSNRNLVAHFELIPIPTYNVSVTANPTEGGTVSGGGTYDEGATATVTATPNDGYQFVNWTEDANIVSTSESYTFTVTSDRSLVAHFELTTYDVSVTANPTAGGTVSGGGTYDESATATVTATPNAGYQFVNWKEGSNVVSTSASYTFTVTSNRNLVAYFELIPIPTYNVSVTANPTAGGTVSGGGTYDEGATATVTATPNDGYQFVNWTEDANIVSTSESYTFTVTSDRSLVAHFELTTYDVSVTANPTEGGTVSGGGTYDEGTSATVTATPNDGYQFVNWTENGVQVSTSASYTFTVSGNRNLTANFEPIQYEVTTTSNPTSGGTTSGGGTYDEGTMATVTATPNAGYHFVNWTEDANIVSTSASYTFTVTSNRNLVAHFELIPTPTYNVSVTANPTTGGTVSGGGTYDEGETVTVTAVANDNYTFVNWTENGTELSTSAVYSFEVTRDINITANFLYITGVEENSVAVEVYPNPANAEMNIVCEGMKRITIISMSGKVMLDTEVANDKKTIDMSRFAQGSYILRINTFNNVITRVVTVTK